MAMTPSRMPKMHNRKNVKRIENENNTFHHTSNCCFVFFSDGFHVSLNLSSIVPRNQTGRMLHETVSYC